MPSKRLQYFLDSNQIEYQVLNHSIAFSALELSAVAHIPEKNVVKTVIVKTPHKMFMCVVSANEVLDIGLFRAILNGANVTLASEQEFSREFPDCEVGAMPPFGNLYDMDVYVSDKLAKHKDVFFNAGNHSEVIKLPYTVFETLVHPKVAHITSP